LRTQTALISRTVPRYVRMLGHWRRRCAVPRFCCALVVIKLTSVELFPAHKHGGGAPRKRRLVQTPSLIGNLGLGTRATADIHHSW